MTMRVLPEVGGWVRGNYQGLGEYYVAKVVRINNIIGLTVDLNYVDGDQESNVLLSNLRPLTVSKPMQQKLEADYNKMFSPLGKAKSTQPINGATGCPFTFSSSVTSSEASAMQQKISQLASNGIGEPRPCIVLFNVHVATPSLCWPACLH